MTRLAPAAVVLLALLAFAAPPAHGSPGWVWPLRGEVITPYRNGDDPYARGQHRGIDIAGPVGAPVVAAAGGVVRFAGVAGYSGLTVGVRTADGRYDTSYLHLSSIAVREGQHVASGDRLGAVGTSGRRSAARPHLHFGVRDAGSRFAYHDPLDFLPPPAPPRLAPRGTPAPVGVPVRRSPVPVRGTEPVRLPRLAPRSAPRGLPGRAPRPIPALRPAPELHGVPAAVARPVPALREAPHSAPRPGPESGPAARPAPLPHPAARSQPGEQPATGPDLGWLLACLGLLLAAALIGAPRARLRRPRRFQARFGALLRPLAGRRRATLSRTGAPQA